MIRIKRTMTRGRVRWVCEQLMQLGEFRSIEAARWAIRRYETKRRAEF